MSCYVYSNDSTVQIPFQCNNVNGSANLLTGEVRYSSYGYEPDQSPTQGFLVLFCVGFAAQLLLSIYWKSWWTLPTLAVGTALECIGWGGRLWSIYSWSWDMNEGGYWYSDFGAFIMQICCLVIAPTFFSAANYILLGKIMSNVGPEYSSLHPQSFSTMFIIADVVCLVVQAAGGGIAGTANTTNGANQGAYIMTGGVIVQLVVTVLFIVVFVEWLWRRKRYSPVKKQFNPFARFYKKKSSKPNHQSLSGSGSRSGSGLNEDGNLETENSSVVMEQISTASRLGEKNKKIHSRNSPNLNENSPRLSEKNLKLMIGLISAGTLLIVIRSFYRAVELADGWTGPIAINEPLFLGLDAALMFIFVYLYAAIHPGLAFGRKLF
ncbi:uncharacterized protein I206_104139 [Kwoniella pini CBS 10737]|uniref:RTA1-domain-containing protein n=1 Tax=Kwoniella pini CBS 10737 TaxID=1296096 RepID=A0AAJ8MQI9_9TREE